MTKFTAKRRIFTIGILNKESRTSPPMVSTEKATIKSPDIAPIPINRVENQAILGATDESNDCLIISRLIGPRGAAKVTPRVATMSHIPNISTNSNL
jgi:hypothetical protein